VIVAHHDDLASGDWDSAWQELSPRYRNRKLKESGGKYSDGSLDTAPSQWVVEQQGGSLGSIDTSGAHVRLAGMKGTAPGDALVKVTGMTSIQHGSSCAYDGYTWVHYQRGKWWYDPGVKHHPERSAEWGTGDKTDQLSVPLFRGRCE
jgi:hypothetical protein